MIELKNISKIYPSAHTKINALTNISLHVNEGEVVGVIGKSGAGKSTLIRCVNLLERPSSGTVHVAGQELTMLAPKALRQMRQQIGMIFQHFHLLDSANIFDNIALPLRLTGCKKEDVRDAVLPLMHLVGLMDKEKAYPSQLSGGQKQRVAIARALVMQPKVLLCDEATSALDPHNTETILRLLKKINQQLNLTILLITHEMQVVKQICDRVVVLENGRIVEQGVVSEVFAYPKTTTAQYFVESVLRVDLPGALQEKIHATESAHTLPLWRIYFCGDAAAEPIIAQLAKDYGIILNILQANLECIQYYTIGIMIASVDSLNANLSAGLAFLASKGLEVKTIGYVARDVI